MNPINIPGFADTENLQDPLSENQQEVTINQLNTKNKGPFDRTDYPKTKILSEEDSKHRDAEEKQIKEEKSKREAPEQKAEGNPDSTEPVPPKTKEEMESLVKNQDSNEGAWVANAIINNDEKKIKKAPTVGIKITPAVAPAVAAMPSSPAMPVAPVSVAPVTTTTIDPLTSFLLNMMFVMLFYFVATKIFTFYGIGTEAYGIYFTFYLFLYITTMILPTEYAKIKTYKIKKLL
jgi:hypothetical protein